MPRFHFDFFNRIAVRDREGMQLPDLDAAIRIGRESAADIIAGEIIEEHLVCLSDYIEIKDDDGKLLHTLRFSDLVEQDT